MYHEYLMWGERPRSKEFRCRSHIPETFWEPPQKPLSHRGPHGDRLSSSWKRKQAKTRGPLNKILAWTRTETMRKRYVVDKQSWTLSKPKLNQTGTTGSPTPGAADEAKEKRMETGVGARGVTALQPLHRSRFFEAKNRWFEKRKDTRQNHAPDFFLLFSLNIY